MPNKVAVVSLVDPVDHARMLHAFGDRISRARFNG